MKIAVTGKGGVGKSTLAAGLALLLARQGGRVLAVDADPDANLASALGLSPAEAAKIVPIAEQAALIEARTGAKVKQYGQMFKLNPEVADIAANFAVSHGGVDLLVLGAVDRGGGGCACPESVLLKALVMNLVLHRQETLILDMEAGIEHLGRGTARGVDTMVIVIEPGLRSVDCARKIVRMAGEIGIRSVDIVANKVASPTEETFVRNAFPEKELLGILPYSEAIRRGDIAGTSVLDNCDPAMLSGLAGILGKLEERHAHE